MKKTILILVLLMTFACKNEKKAEVQADMKQVKEEKIEAIKIFNNEDLVNWSKVRVDLNPVFDIFYKEKSAYLLSRGTTFESSYLSTPPIPVNYASDYKINLIVKKGKESDYLGLRIAGNYPDRVDAVFNLNKGVVLGCIAAQDFESPQATITSLGEGWYKCTLSATVASDDIRIIFGATNLEKNISGWEGKTSTLGSIYFVPSSLMVEKVQK